MSRLLFSLLLFFCMMGVATYGYVQVPKNSFEFSPTYIKGTDTGDEGVAIGVGYGLTDALQLNVGYSYYTNSVPSSIGSHGEVFFAIDDTKNQTITIAFLGLTSCLTLPYSSLRLSGSAFGGNSSYRGSNKTLEGISVGAQFLLGNDWVIKPYVGTALTWYSQGDTDNSHSYIGGLYIVVAEYTNLIVQHTSDLDGEGLTSVGVSWYPEP